jgi:hypothetical protein
MVVTVSNSLVYKKREKEKKKKKKNIPEKLETSLESHPSLLAVLGHVRGWHGGRIRT